MSGRPAGEATSGEPAEGRGGPDELPAGSATHAHPHGRHVTAVRDAATMARSLDYDDLAQADLAGLVRLATWLGVMPPGPWRNERDKHHAVARAVQAAEGRIAKAPHAFRHHPTAGIKGFRPRS